jgi:phospholipase C
MKQSSEDGFKMTATYAACICAATMSAALLAGCGGTAVPRGPTDASGGARQAANGPIQHVVFIIQENRSFNDLFLGYPRATTQSYGYDSDGNKIALKPEDLSTLWDVEHLAHAFFAACDGQGSLPGTDCRMDGWNHELGVRNAPPDAAYGYVPRSEIVPYWTLAQRYVLADENFASNLDASFAAHQYAVAAQAHRSVDYPTHGWGCESRKDDKIPTLTDRRTYGRDITPCFKMPTLGGRADKAGVSWRFYAASLGDTGGDWSAYQADRDIYGGPDWNADVVNPPSQFLTDVGNGELANITWITPVAAASDHAGMQSSAGPAWVASVVDAVGNSPFWSSTAIFIIWDDWGGFFDPVPPVFEDYDGLGFRVPLIVVSPYARTGSVTHVQYETASVLRFIEDNFGLRQLAASDARANDPAWDPAVFDFLQRARAFDEIPGARPLPYWQRLERQSKARGKPADLLGD